LQHLTGQIERKILRVNDTFNEAKPFRDEFFAVIGDEDASDVELDVVLLSLGFEEIKGCAFGDEEDCSEFQLPFD
jgi:hypothetical protein